MFFFQRNSSPLFFTSRCSSLSLLFSLSFASPFRLLSHFLCLSLSFFSKFVNMTINLSLIAQLSRGKLPIRENLVIKWPYTDRPPSRPSVRTTGIPMLNNSINRYGNQSATQGFIWKEIAWPPGLLERKNNNEVVSFSTLFERKC